MNRNASAGVAEAHRVSPLVLRHMALLAAEVAGVAEAAICLAGAENLVFAVSRPEGVFDAGLGRAWWPHMQRASTLVALEMAPGDARGAVSAACAFGLPLRSAQGALLGALYLLHHNVRNFEPHAIAGLSRLADVLAALIECDTEGLRHTGVADFLEQVDEAVYFFEAASLLPIYASRAATSRFGPLPCDVIGGGETVSAGARRRATDDAAHRHGVYEEVHARLEEMIRGKGVPERFEMPFRGMDGATGVAECVVHRCSLAARDAYCVAMRDVTETHALEQALTRARVEMEGRVAERTADLKRTLNDLQVMAAMLSHDLKQPIRAILGFAEQLPHDAAADTQETEAVDRIRANARHLGDMADALIDHLRSLSHPLRPARVDMARAVQASWRDLATLRTARAAQLEVDDLPAAEADPVLIRRAIDNLLSNAIKYASPDRTLRVRIGGRRAAQANMYYVRDNGIGFDAAEAGGLFQPFRRLRLRGAVEGVGLGLASVRHVIERHGGTIWAESQPGRGSTFYFTLPGAGDSIARRAQEAAKPVDQKSGQ